MRLKILKYVISDILKNKLVIGYVVLLAIIGWSVFLLDDNVSKSMLSLLNIILLVVPLVCIIFTATYMYNSSEFIYVLLSQPVQRKKIWAGLFYGLCIAFILAILLALGIPILIYSPNLLGLMMMIAAVFITAIFIALAMFCASLVRDKAKGIGLAIMLWLFFALVFDGILLFVVFQFADYAIEKPMVFLNMLNPVGLGRVLILLQMDVSVLMGYSGAVFKKYLGTGLGIAVSFLMLFIWILIPFLFSLKKFTKSDL